MAYDIGPRIGIEGEREYKQAISEIANGQKVLRSELELVTAKFNGQEGSIEALNAKHDVLQRTLYGEQEKVDKLREALQHSAETYGEADKRTMNWQIQLNKAEAELEKTKQQISKTEEDLDELNDTESKATEQAKKFGDAQKNTGDNMRGLGDMLDSVAQKFGVQLPEGMRNTVNGLGQIDVKTLAFAGTAAALVTALVKVEKKLIDMTKQSAEWADEILTTSTITGISTEKLQGYAYAAELVDVSLETLTSAQTKLVNNMQAATEGSSAQTEAFNKLGVSVVDANGKLRNSEDVMWNVLDALGQVSNETERDALAMDIMGKSARELNPLIEAGSAQLTQYAEEAKSVGYVLSEDQLDALGRVDDAYQRLSKTVDAAKNQLAAQFAPSLANVTDMATEFVTKVGKTFKETHLVETFGSLLENVAGLLEPIGEIIDWAGPGLAATFDVITRSVALLSDTLRVVVGMLQIITFQFGKGTQNIKTGLGLNISNGQLSAQQKIEYKSALTTNTYDPTTGTWVGNGYNAAGTPNWRGGISWVGENGPERVYLPAGTAIQTAQESRMAGGDNFYITIDAKSVKEFNDIVALAQNARFTARMR